MKRRTSPFTKAQIRQAIQAAKAEGVDRAELISPDGYRVVLEVAAREKQQPEPVEELE